MSEAQKQPVAIDPSRIAPMPDPEMIGACAQIAAQSLPHEQRLGMFCAAEIAARHGFLQGWYAGLQRGLEVAAKELSAIASGMEARQGGDPKGLHAKHDSPVGEAEMP